MRTLEYLVAFNAVFCSLLSSFMFISLQSFEHSVEEHLIDFKMEQGKLLGKLELVSQENARLRNEIYTLDLNLIANMPPQKHGEDDGHDTAFMPVIPITDSKGELADPEHTIIHEVH